MGDSDADVPTAVLVARGGAIGDFVLTLPVLTALRARFPQARLDVLGLPGIAGLAVAGGLARSVIALDSRALAGFFVPNAPLDSEVARRLAEYDLVISFLHDPAGDFVANVGRCTSARVLQGRHRPDPAGTLHATDTFLAPLAEVGIYDPDPVPRLCIAPALRDRDREDLPMLAVHPGSGSECKNWPESCWAELLGRLAGRCDWELLLIGGEAEGERTSRLAAVWPEARLEVAHGLPLTELAARLASCRFFLGHDSGITHLAAALGVPGVALWGESRAEHWRPRSDGFRLIHSRTGLAQLPVDGVVEVVVARLATLDPGRNSSVMPVATTPGS